MKLLIAILMITYSAQSLAIDAFYLPFTKHFSECLYTCDSGKYNESNHVTGISGDKYTAFVMNNSYNKLGVFVGRKLSLDYNEYITGFAVAGLVTGYGNVMPTYKGIGTMGYVGVDIHKKGSKYGLIITSLPVKEGVINIGFRYSL